MWIWNSHYRLVQSFTEHVWQRTYYVDMELKTSGKKPFLGQPYGECPDEMWNPKKVWTKIETVY